MRLRKRVPLFLFFLAAGSGCVKHSDYLATFEFSGVVLDRSDKSPVKGANAVFIDTGLDSVRSKTPDEREVGTTDSQGRIGCGLDYSWGEETGILKSSPKRIFDVSIRKPGYVPKTLHFEAKQLRKRGRTFEVDIGMIELDRDNVRPRK